ncbi:MAG: phosphate ABC transporter permease subunit PstC [Oscillospiraceae bacterium]|jgi:phosphate transport system permease protein|nr:phosphate ABC transporter permease subunit PstC [Oscillospiraceae bacterium]
MKEKIMRAVFLAAACVCILCVAAICLFLLVNGLPAFGKIGPLKFLSGSVWRPGSGAYGIAPMILGSLYVTAGAIALGAPLGVLTGVYLARFCPRRARAAGRAAVNLLAGVPSVVYGFFGLVVLVPAASAVFGGSGKSMLTASVLLGLMILPTVISVTETSVRAVPEACYEGALALGATHERAVFFAVLPAARPGVTAGIALGVGRAIGEATAVVMVAGNQPVIPSGPLRGLRTLTANIVLEMGYAADLHRGALAATAVTLFVFTLAVNVLLALGRGKRPA